MKRNIVIAVAVLALIMLTVVIRSWMKPDPLSGSYEVSTARFTQTNPITNSTQSLPGIWIDTNTKISGLGGGTVKSHKPYDIHINFTDNDELYDKLVITRLEVRYDDGSVDPATAQLKLPMTIKAREYETVNSGVGGKVIRKIVMLLSARIKDVITRDAPLTIYFEGYFQKKDGGKVPLKLEPHFNIETDNSTKSALDVLIDK